MELSFNFIAVIFITIRALAKSKIITYVRGKLKNLHDEIKCFSIIDFNCFSNPFRNFFYFMIIIHRNRKSFKKDFQSDLKTSVFLHFKTKCS